MAIGLKRSGGGAAKSKSASRTRRHLRVRKQLRGSTERPRLVVNRSSRHVFVQVVDDTVGKTLASASTMEADLRGLDGDKTAKAKKVGELVAERAKPPVSPPWSSTAVGTVTTAASPQLRTAPVRPGWFSSRCAR